MNKEHPELLEGEMFLTNITIDQYYTIGFKTKRHGNTAYSKTGYVVGRLVPVFVQKKEYDEHMVAIRNE